MPPTLADSLTLDGLALIVGDQDVYRKWLEITKNLVRDPTMDSGPVARQFAALLSELWPPGRPEVTWHLGQFFLHMIVQIPFTAELESRSLCSVVLHLEDLHMGRKAFPEIDRRLLHRAMRDFTSILRKLEDPRIGYDYDSTLNWMAFLARLVNQSFFPREWIFVIACFTLETRTCDGEEGIVTDQWHYDTCWSMGAMFIAEAGEIAYYAVTKMPVPADAASNSAYERGRQYHGALFGMERWNFWRSALQAAHDRVLKPKVWLFCKALRMMAFTESNGENAEAST